MFERNKCQLQLGWNCFLMLLLYDYPRVVGKSKSTSKEVSTFPEPDQGLSSLRTARSTLVH